jgi:type IX secretion system PorP/SprF family membrane protein
MTNNLKFLAPLFIMIAVLLLNANVYAQDPNFSQFYNQPVQNNPAFAGLNNGLRFSALYRNLWARIPGKFNTFACAMDVEALNYGGGLGLLASSDVEGEGMLTTKSIGGQYAYRFVYKDYLVQAGFQTSVYTQRLDYSQLIFTDQLDPRYGLVHPQSSGAVPLPANSKTFIDFTSGFVVRKNIHPKNNHRRNLATINLGYAAHHITRPDQSLLNLDARLPIKHSFQFNAVIPVNTANDAKNPGLIIPAALLEFQNEFREFVVGLNCMKAPLFGGVFYRSRVFRGLPNTADIDAVTANIGLEVPFNKNTIMRICYSYDVTVNNLRGFSPGTHEIGVLLWFKEIYKHKNRNSKKAMPCYGF